MKVNNRSFIQLINIFALFSLWDRQSVIGIVEQVVTLGEWLEDKDDECSPLMKVVEDGADQIVSKAGHVVCPKDPIH